MEWVDWVWKIGFAGVSGCGKDVGWRKRHGLEDAMCPSIALHCWA